MYKPLAGVCVATAIFVCAANGGPVPPSKLPPQTGTLTLSSTSPPPVTLLAGASVNIHGSGFLSDADVAIAVYSLPATLDEVTARSDGTFDDTVTLPSSLTGDHTLVAIGDGPGDSAVSLEAAVRLEAPTSTPSSSSPTAAGRLATSGIDAGAIALGGLALIAIGLLLLRSVTLWRRRLRRRGWEHISP